MSRFISQFGALPTTAFTPSEREKFLARSPIYSVFNTKRLIERFYLRNQLMKLGSLFSFGFSPFVLPKSFELLKELGFVLAEDSPRRSASSGLGTGIVPRPICSTNSDLDKPHSSARLSRPSNPVGVRERLTRFFLSS